VSRWADAAERSIFMVLPTWAPAKSGSDFNGATVKSRQVPGQVSHFSAWRWTGRDSIKPYSFVT